MHRCSPVLIMSWSSTFNGGDGQSFEGRHINADVTFNGKLHGCTVSRGETRYIVSGCQEV